MLISEFNINEQRGRIQICAQFLDLVARKSQRFQINLMFLSQEEEGMIKEIFNILDKKKFDLRDLEMLWDKN